MATIAFTPLIKRIAIRFDILDYPAERRINKIPIPRLGGAAMFLGGVTALIVLIIGHFLWGWIVPFGARTNLHINYISVAFGVFTMFVVGVIDDIIGLRPLVKFSGQILAAIIVCMSGLLFSDIHWPIGDGYIGFGWWTYPITVFYLVAFANVINLIDGLDGLAAGICAISGTTIFLFAVSTARYDAAVFSIVLVGICIGFLRYNFNPASIFMGDSGALLLGFSLGIVSLLATTRSALFVSLLVPIIAAGIPIMDTFFSIIRRIRSHQPITKPDAQHIHHRLLEQGYSQKRAVIILWIWTVMLSVCGVWITKVGGWQRLPFVIIIIVVSVYLIHKLHLLRPAVMHRYNRNDKQSDKEAYNQRGGNMVNDVPQERDEMGKEHEKAFANTISSKRK